MRASTRAWARATCCRSSPCAASRSKSASRSRTRPGAASPTNSPSPSISTSEPRVHESAGACVVGVRPLLIAYNVNLKTNDLSIAKRIARAVRVRDGGLLHLKALGFELESRGVVQVSMNLTSYERTNLHQAFEAVRREAERLGVEVLASEIVGLVPRDALYAAAAHFLKLENYTPDVVLENRIAAAVERKRAEQDEDA